MTTDAIAQIQKDFTLITLFIATALKYSFLWAVTSQPGEDSNIKDNV